MAGTLPTVTIGDLNELLQHPLFTDGAFQPLQTIVATATTPGTLLKYAYPYAPLSSPFVEYVLYFFSFVSLRVGCASDCRPCICSGSDQSRV